MYAVELDVFELILLHQHDCMRSKSSIGANVSVFNSPELGQPEQKFAI